MSRDIRSFFLPKGKFPEKSKQSNEGIKNNKKKKRVIVIDSDSDEATNVSPKKKKSDSDKRSSEKKKTNTKPGKLREQKKSEKLKPVNLSDVFGNDTFKRSSLKPNVIPEDNKAKSNGGTEQEVIHSDEEFEATLCQLDEIEGGMLSHICDASDSKTKLPAPNKTEKRGESPCKTSQEMKEHSHGKSSTSEKREETPSKASLRKKERNCFKSPSTSENIQKCSEDEAKIAVKELTPSKSNESMGANMDSPTDFLEKKRQHALNYMKYLQRGGPKHPGSKEVPEGKPGCFSGLVFVITGVLDSLEKDEAVGIIEKYGGKVTTNISRKTSYLIYGDEPGSSKLEKASTLGTPKINEDEFLKLIILQSENLSSKNHEDSHDSKSLKKRPNYIKDEIHKLKKMKVDNDSKDMLPIKNQETINSDADSTIKPVFRTHELQESKKPVQKQICSVNNAPQLTTNDTVASCENLQSSIWVDKYRPTKTKQVIGQQGDRSSLKKLTFWLENWSKNHSGDKKHIKPSPWAKNDDGAFFKTALLSGPPGIGKTTMAHLVSKELGFDIVEFNASDTRSKKLLHQEITELLSSKTLAGYFTPNSNSCQPSVKRVLIMDEVDGMAGNEDRGGVQELIQLIKTTRVPIICMCNDRNHPKIRSLANYCYDLRVMKPRLEQIRGAMMSVCFKEGLKISADALNDIICGANFDIRQILHHLSLWAAKEKHMSSENLQKGCMKIKKDMKLGAWDVVKKVFSIDEHKDMSIHEKSDLFFYDYSINPLFVQENYLSVVPAAAKGSVEETLQCIARTADSISMGDVVEKCIRGRGAWSLLPVQAMYSSVIPGNIMEGYMRGQINFPAWLGKNSRTGKLDRLLQELHVHTRLSTSCSKQALNMEYLTHLRNAILHPLIVNGSAGVPDALNILQSYNLLREDLESILELTVWPNQKDPVSAVESKVKAALTRAYNKEGILTPYSVVSVVKKRSAGVSNDFEDDVAGESEEEDDKIDDIGGDAMIKTKKVVRSEDVGKGLKGKGKNSIDSSRGSQKKGRGKGK